jgi:mono/diheme cytochrome c family protein
MRWERSVLWLGVACASFAGAAFAGCSSNSNSPPSSDMMDATADDGSTEAATMEASTTPEAGPDADGESMEAATEAGPDAGGDASDGAVEAAVEAGPTCVVVDPSTLDAGLVEAGSSVANNVNPTCGTCHGPDYSGGMAVGGALSKNLTPDPVTGLGCWTDDQIVTAILYGTTPDGTTLCAAMPRWSTRGVTNDQAHEIVQFLRSLPAVVNNVAPSACEIPPDAGTDSGTDGGDAGDGGT